MGPATITSTWFLHCHLSPMLAALGQHPCCSWPKQRKTIAPSELVRRQRNLAKPSYCPPRSVLPSPASSWYQTTLWWGQHYLHISGVQLQSRDCLCRWQSKVLWRFQHSVRNGQLLNCRAKFAPKSGSGDCVSQRNPTSTLFLFFLPQI